MKPKSQSRHSSILPANIALSLGLAVAGLSQSAQAATYYWDNNGASAGFGTAGGTWAAPTTSQWSTDGTGVATPGASITTATTDTLNFGNGATGLGAGTISVSGTVSAGNMTFASGSGAILLSGGTITLAAADTITVDNTTDTISSTLSGAGTSLTKSGAGTLTLSGTSTITGSLKVSNGTVALTTGGSFASSAFDFVGSTASQTGIVSVASGATLNFSNTNGGGLGYASAASGAIYNYGTFNATQLYMSDAVNNGSYGYVRNAGTMSSGNTLAIARNNNANVVDVVAGGATTVSPTANGGLTLASGANATAGLNITGGGTFADSRSGAQEYINGGAGGAYSSINISGAGSKLTMTGDAGFDMNHGSNSTNVVTLTLNNGGELDMAYSYRSGSVGTQIINFNGGTYKATAADGSGIIQAGISAYVHSGGATINSNSFNISLPVALLAPTGNGITSISGTYTGYIGAPVVKITDTTGAGAAAIAIFDPATGQVTITMTSPGSGYSSSPTITLVGGKGGSTGSSATTVSAGNITTGAAASGGLTKIGAGALTLSAANTYSGGTTVGAGTLTVGTGGTLGASTGALTVNNANTGAGTAVILNLATAVDTTVASLSGTLATPSSGTNTTTINNGGSGRNFTVNQTATGTFDGVIAGAGAFKLGSLSTNALTLTGANTYTGTTTLANGTLLANSANALNTTALGGNVTFTGGTLKYGSTFAAGANADVSSRIKNSTSAISIDTNSQNVAFANALASSNTGGLTKGGGGKLTLSATGNYTGATAVNLGTLQVDAGLSATSGVTVASGATFAGAGTVAGTTTINAATLTNTSASTALTLGALTFGGASTVNLNNGGTASLVVTGALATGGNAITLNVLTGPAWANGTTYNLISYGVFSGALGDFTTNTIAGLGARQSATLGNSGSAITLAIAGDTPYWTGANSTSWTTNAIGNPFNWKLLTAGTNTEFLANDQVLFNDSASGSGTVTVDISNTDVNPASVNFANVTRDYVISGGKSITSGSMTKDGAAKVTISTANSFTGATAVNAGTLNIQNSASLGATSGVAVASGAALELQNGIAVDARPLAISGAGLTASPAGALRNVSGANSFAGLITLGANATIQSDAGSLTLSNTGTITGSGFNLTLDGAGDGSIAGSIGTGAGSLIKNGMGTWTLSGANSYSGVTSVNTATLKAGSTGALSAGSAYTLANTAGVVLDITGFNNSVGSLSGGGTSGGNVTLGAATLTAGADNTITTYAGVIGGTGGFTKAGTGTMTLSGANTFTGATTINAGTLTASGGSAIADTSAVSLANVSGAIFNLANSETIGSLAGGGATGGNATLGANTLTTGGNNTSTTYAGVLSGTGGAVIKNGTGTWTLTGTNLHTGGTTLNAGTLVVGNNSALGTGTVALNSGTLTSSNNSGNDPTITNAITAGGGAIAGGAGTLFHINGNITGSAALGLSAIYNGSGLRLEGDNSGFTGTATVTGANVRLGAATAGSALAAWVVNGNLQTDVANGATFNLGSLGGSGNISGHANNGSAAVSTLSVGALNTNDTFSGTIINNAQNNAATGNTDGTQNNVLALTKVGSGTLTLSGTNTYTGLTTVTNGKLIVNGSISTSAVTVQSGATLGGSGTVGALTVESGGTVSPGNSPGILNVNGNYNQAGTLAADLNGTAVGTQYDQVNVTGTVTLSGLLALTVGYTPANGDMLFLVANDGTDAINGNFAGLAQGAEFIQGGQKWSIHYNADSTTSSFTGGNDVALMAIPEPRAALLGGLGMLMLLRRRRSA